MDENPLKWPKAKDEARLNRYQHGDLLYRTRHFEAFSIKGQKDFSERYNKLRYVVGNFCRLSTNTVTDMLFGEDLKFDVDNTKGQSFIDNLILENGLLTQLHESGLGNSRRGDAIFKMRGGQRNLNLPSSASTVIIEEITPAYYFPELTTTSGRYQPDKDVLAYTFRQNGKTYLKKEIHTPGYINYEVYEYDESKKAIVAQQNVADFGLPEIEQTGVERSLIFHVPNIRDGEFWGANDYEEIESLQFALNNRMTKTDNILDKHSDPILLVPDGVIDENGEVRKEALGMFEISGESQNKPEYLTWNANLDAAFAEVDKLVEFLFMFSEISSAGTPIDKEGGKAESGRALKFRLLSTIRKRNRKRRYYDQVIKEMILTAQQFSAANGFKVGGETAPGVDLPTIVWPDGIVNDPVEMTDIATARIDNGTMSRADGIVYLDGSTPEDAKAKVEEIDEETAPTLPPVNNNVNGNANNQEQ